MRQKWGLFRILPYVSFLANGNPVILAAAPRNSMSGRAALTVQPVEALDDSDDRSNPAQFWAMALFVAAFAAVSLSAYLWLRPPNRHQEPTPYDAIISQLRSTMTEDDVLAIYRNAKDGNPRAAYSASDETIPSGPRRVLVFKLGADDPLTVRLGGPSGNTVAEWCYEDHCYNNIE
jgi:hypothetical protein